MKPAILLFCTLSLAGAAEFSETRTVFLMPMNHSFDQFIASRLTRMHVLQVVTDPAKADTVLTDQVGEQLQDRLSDLYPAPKPAEDQEPSEAAQAAAPAAAAEGAKPAGGAQAGDNAKPAEAAKPAESAKKEEPSRFVPPPMFGETANKAEKRGYMSTFGHGRGTIFLVDVKSRQVLWSAFEKPKSSSPSDMDHAAERVVKRLKDDLEPKPKKVKTGSPQ